MPLTAIPSILCALYLQNTVLRLTYGMAAITHYFRLIELVYSPNNFTNWIDKVIFVHWWHDCRNMCKAINKKKLFKTQLSTIFRLVVNEIILLYLLLNLSLLIDLVPIICYYPLRWFLGTAYFIGMMYLVDVGYRLPLLLLTDKSVPSAMNDIFKSNTLKEFWTERWNKVIQTMLQIQFIYQLGEKQDVNLGTI